VIMTIWISFARI